MNLLKGETMHFQPTNTELRDRLLHGGGAEQIGALGFRVPVDAMNAFRLWGSIIEVTGPYRCKTGDRLFSELSEPQKAAYRDAVIQHYNAQR